MADSKVTIAVETIINNAMVEIVQHFAEKDGVCIKGLYVDWIEMSTMSGEAAMVRKITMETTYRPSWGKRNDDDNG